MPSVTPSWADLRVWDLELQQPQEGGEGLLSRRECGPGRDRLTISLLDRASMSTEEDLAKLTDPS